MTRISEISIYSAGRDCVAETQHPVICTVKPACSRVECRDLITGNSVQIQNLMACCRIGEIVSEWLKSDYPDCTFDLRFASVTDYLGWKKAVMFCDVDVAWHCRITFSDGTIVLLVETGEGNLPDELEAFIRIWNVVGAAAKGG